MRPNRSPWIHQLKRTRPVTPLGEHRSADVVIVGGGIAGAVTAFFTLRDTNENVLLLEADKVAHGATGHNAGQITSYFERPLHDLAREFGIEKAIEGQRAIESAWMLIEEILDEIKIRTPLYRFTGYEGHRSLPQLLSALKNNECRKKGGLPVETILVAQEWKDINQVLPHYDPLFTLAPQADILALLETNNSAYIASASYQKGCMNSALFVEELLGYLTTRYKLRFKVFEGSPVKTVTLKDNHAELLVKNRKVVAKRVVLCTNGFENFTIENNAGPEINTSFHHLVRGRIGYMAGYVEALNSPPTAISYRVDRKESSKDPTGDTYFYLTRRPHEHDASGPFNLICTGGPEKVLPNQAGYSREDSCPEDQQEIIDEFLKENYRGHSSEEREYSFCWHGLMGYTPNGVRRIGPEPINPVLLYNLGCNGVGILPSIYGGHKISKFLKGEALPPSIFDPHDQR